MLKLAELNSSFGYGYTIIPNWEDKIVTFFSQPPPWTAHAMMITVIGLTAALLWKQHQMRRAMMQQFTHRQTNRKEIIKALAEDIILDGFEKAVDKGLLTDAEKENFFKLLADGKPKLIGLVPRKSTKLTWRARNALLQKLKDARAARIAQPEKPVPLPDPVVNKTTIKGTGKLAALAHRTFK